LSATSGAVTSGILTSANGGIRATAGTTLDLYKATGSGAVVLAAGGDATLAAGGAGHVARGVDQFELRLAGDEQRLRYVGCDRPDAQHHGRSDCDVADLDER
jgi:hypothetical protein